MLQRKTNNLALLVIVIFSISFLAVNNFAQSRLPNMPGYEQYKKMAMEIRGSVKSDWRFSEWDKVSSGFSYFTGGKKFSYNIDSKSSTEIPGAAPANMFGRRLEGPERGRQFTSSISPDKKLKSFYKNRNLWLSDADGKNEIAITTEGNEKERIKFGSASWVYGEELDQNSAMWWSPDNKKIAFYRFDEGKAKDYYLQYKQLSLYDSVEVEPYVKVGGNNPIVDLFVYDLDTKKTTKIDVRDGQPFSNSVVGHYIYGIDWTNDGSELLFHRTNRKQNIMEYAAADPLTGKTRVIVHEEWLASYTKNSPEMKFLKDGKRFIWASERNGFKNYYLYDLSGKLISILTSHQFETAGIVSIDEAGKALYYMARSGDNHMKLQLHKTAFDGKDDVRLTNPSFNHTAYVSPNYKYFVDIAQTHDSPPIVKLMDIRGKEISVLFNSDLTKFNELGLKKAELFTYKAADGITDLHGLIFFPSNFDETKKYPVLVSVYAGPETNGARETFSLPNALSEYGFLILSLDSRSAAGRGKKFMDPYYGNLGIVEMDDQAAGVKSLWNRPYINKERVGIFGTSYGGTASAMCLLRYPDVFQAACANSGVMDFRNYDNIYTERHQGLIEENGAGYDKGNACNYAKNLKGHLMIYYGTSDNNVHPSNSLQLIDALQKAGKSFEVQVGPDLGHTAVNRDRMMEFFIEHLIMN